MKKGYILSIALLFCAMISKGQWTELGRGANALNANSYIYGVISDAAGNVYAAGEFTDGVSPYVAKWNGTNWTALGSGNHTLSVNDNIRTMAIDPAGNIYVGGYFYDAGSNTWYVAKWDGSDWSALGSMGANSYIYSVVADAGGNVYAAGQFMDANNKQYVSKWNGSTWSTLGTGSRALNANDHINSLATDAAGNVYAGGYFVNVAGRCYVAKFSPADTTWHELTGSHPLNSLTVDEYIYAVTTDAAGNVYAAGGFANADGNQYVAKWNGTDWAELGTGTNRLHANDFIYTLTTDAAGNVYAAGAFTDSSGSPYVAKWNGTRWTEVSQGGDSLHGNDYVYALHITHDGSLLAGGYFTDSAGHQYVAKFAATGTGVVDGTDQSLAIHIYPNPLSGIMNLDISDESLIGAAINVTNVIGEIVWMDKVSASHQQLHIANAPKGIYMISIRNQTKSIGRKIVIE